MTRAIQADGAGVKITVHVVPRASRTALAGLHDDALRIRLAAPPVDGKANRTLIEFIAKTLKVPQRQVQLLAGDTARRKYLHVTGLTLESALQLLSNPTGG